MSEFIPGYSDEPQYWTNAYKNDYIRRFNVGFIKHKLAQVCRGDFVCQTYLGDVQVRLSDPGDLPRVTEMLRYYTGSKPYWRDVGGMVFNGKQWEEEYDIITGLSQFRHVEEDGYVLRPLLPDDGEGYAPVKSDRW